MRWVCVFLMVGLVACSQSDGPGGTAESPKRQLDPRFHEVARRFADAVVARDYDAAYTLMASAYQQEAGRDEFMKSITRYRDHVDGTLAVQIRASDDNPSTLRDDSVVQLFVPDRYRPLLLDEAILNFDVPGRDGWALVMWFVEEAGSVRILQFYQDD